MKKILLTGTIILATISLTDSVFAHYRGNNYQSNYTYNSQYTVRQISPCLSYKYNYYGQLIETMNTCNNYYSYPINNSYPCTQPQTYPYINNCNTNYNVNYWDNNYQYNNYNNCSYYYYDIYGNYTCGNSNLYYPSTNYNSIYTPTNYYPYYYGY
jgi:hypothetical protein